MIKQISVFLENDKGRLAALCRCLADAGVNMSALSIADTPEYGPGTHRAQRGRQGKAALDDAGLPSLRDQGHGWPCPIDRAGLWLELLETLDDADISVEYWYCFSHQDGNAIFALKVTDSAQAAEAVFAIERAGFQILEEGELD